MTRFIDILTGIKTILDKSSGGQYSVSLGQRGISGTDFNKSPEVCIYYASGSFPASGGQSYGFEVHSGIFRIVLTVYARAELSLSILEDSGALAADKSQALADMTSASEVAELTANSLISRIRDTLMSSLNQDLEMPAGTILKKSIPEIRKGSTVNESGEIVTIEASLDLHCEFEEALSGDNNRPQTGALYTKVNMSGDTAVMEVE